MLGSSWVGFRFFWRILTMGKYLRAKRKLGWFLKTIRWLKPSNEKLVFSSLVILRILRLDFEEIKARLGFKE